MRVRPLHDYVLIRCEPLKEDRSGIIVLTQFQRVLHGEVLAVGPGRYVGKAKVRTPMALKVGDRVAFFRENMEHKQGQAIEHVLIELSEELGADLALMRERDILGGVGANTEVST